MDETSQKVLSAARIARGGPALLAAPTSGIKTSTSRRCSLTSRERDVLELMAFGLSNKEIAQRLGLGRRTVETHVDHVLRKLDVPTRTRAVSEGIRLALIRGALGDAASPARLARPSNLPHQLTALLGRAQDLAVLKSSLEAHRLVTISGSGGVGKTKLALRLGFDLLDSYQEGVWFCDFSPLSNPKLVAGVVAKVLGVNGREDCSLTDSIVRKLRRNHSLIILDNCEHVLNVVGDLADEILHECMNIHILATSRQALGIIGEIVHRLPSLAVPETTEFLDAVGALRYAAIGLFVDRAHASDMNFTLTNDNARSVAEICRRLDGIPLAIELAATRVRALSVHRLANSLDDRFELITNNHGTALPRHQTLAALIDWSYELLTAKEQEFFRRAAIFAGGFGLTAAMAVCGGDGIEENTVLDLLSSLTDKSLVIADTVGKVERYRLLDSTRAYALAKVGTGNERDQLSRRHAEYFRDEAITAGNQWRPLSAESVERLQLELGNYSAALEWALTARGDVVLGATLASLLCQLWCDGLLHLGGYWIGRGLEELDESAHPQLAADLWRALAMISWGKRRHESARRALAFYESVGDEHGAAWALVSLTSGLFQTDRREDAAAANARALTLMRKWGDKYGEAQSLNWAMNLGDCLLGVDARRELFAQAVEAFKVLRHKAGIGNMFLNLAEIEFGEGNTQQALDLVRKALEMNKSFPMAYCNLAVYLIAADDLGKAQDAVQQGMRLSYQRQDTISLINSLQHYALLGALGGQFNKAARLIGYVDRQYEQLGAQRDISERWGYEKLMVTLRERLSQADIDAFAAEGSNWPEDRAVEEALRF